MPSPLSIALFAAAPLLQDSGSAELRPFAPEDVFELEVAADPQLAPDGRSVVYVRRSFDARSDRTRTQLWIVESDGSEHRPLTDGAGNPSAPSWSPDGGRLAYLSGAEGSPQIHVRWMDSGQSARLTQLEESPGAPVWSPDGRWLAFSMHVASAVEPFAKLPAKPEGAEWAPAPKLITALHYRSDGAGYLEEGHRQLFVVPAEGGTPRQLTQGEFDVRGRPRWTPDGSALLFSSNRREDAELEPMDTEVWACAVEDGELRALTDRRGPDNGPVISPDGEWFAYTGFDDRYQGYQVRRLYVARLRGAERGEARVLNAALDRSVGSPMWDADSGSIVFSYDDRGNSRLARVTLAGGELTDVTDGLGGTSLGRPYASGSFDLGPEGAVVYTRTTPARPADLYLARPGADAPLALTALNEDLLAQRDLAPVEELWLESSHDGRALQAWLAFPPGFDPTRSYPLILEIHGGPFANYGDRFSAEVQLYAAAGYLVLYMNPRGSTSYGEEFGNLIHHDYPGHDYDDLMSAVDAVLQRGYVDPEGLFVTGGSGGGVLTAWIVGKTQRFRAAVVAKPVINWTSFALTADMYPFFTRYWFPGPPWEIPEQYFARSPLSLVGNVSTPTMVLTGEEDYRTPISESEQYYQALKLREVEAALVRIPEASHGITSRPSRLFTKTAYILEWFERHRSP